MVDLTLVQQVALAGAVAYGAAQASKPEGYSGLLRWFYSAVIAAGSSVGLTQSVDPGRIILTIFAAGFFFAWGNMVGANEVLNKIAVFDRIGDLFDILIARKKPPTS